ncbi:MAG: two-component system alkaline phosphatase synthesis response regulator PhoP [Planctomycetota bacterium]
MNDDPRVTSLDGLKGRKLVSRETVLVIEDEPDIVELIQYWLEREGYVVLTAMDGEKGLAEALRHEPDLILLDVMMPGMDGLEVCRHLREAKATENTPLIMLTARSEETDVVVGLELGADDYVTKPFSPRQLVARVRAHLRRESRTTSDEKAKTRIERENVVLDAERHELGVNGELVELTRAEFRLLWTLFSKPGRVYSRTELVDILTGGDAYILERNVDVHVSAVRKKLGDSGHLIVTIRGVGYKCRD